MGKIKTKRHTLLIDTREQRPLKFFHPEIKPKSCTLKYGDYRMVFSDGTISRTVFERKSLSDAYGSLTQGHDRFRREIIRAKTDKVTLIIIIERSLSDVFSGIKYSKVQGISIIKALFSLWPRYGVMRVFVNNRKEATAYIEQHYMAEWRKMQEETK
jgi:ERCC4-type nuclease